MLEFLCAQQNMPFTVSIGIMLFIALIEGVGAIIGFGVSDMIHSLFPSLHFDIDIPDLDADLDGHHVDIDASSGFTKLLGWLRIGQVPFMAWLILFLTSFGLIGLIAQTISENITGMLLPGSIGSIIAFVATLPVVRVCGRFIAKVMPQDETDAVSEASFIGRTATLVLGTASAGKAAQAKLRDQHGTTHYIMVEPDVADQVFSQGDTVLVVSQAGAVYKVIEDTISDVTHQD